MVPAEQGSLIEKRLVGIPLSPGVAIGRPCFYVACPGDTTSLPSSPTPNDEISRLRDSIERISRQRSVLAEETAALLGQEHAEIFEAQRLMLDDVFLQEELLHAVDAGGCNAAEAVQHVFGRYRSQLSSSDSVYLRERVADIAEIEQALLGDLRRVLACRHCIASARCSVDRCRLGNDHVLFGRTISASLPIETDSHTAGFVVDKGGPTCHAAILARALHRPMVGNISNLPNSIPARSQILVDGDKGEIILNPSTETLAHYRTTRPERGPKILKAAPVEGLRIMANISLSADVDHALAAAAEGVGLYRTEMEMLAAGRPLGEDEQAVRYTKVVMAMTGWPVYIRLLDLHHDKNAEPTGSRERDFTASSQAGKHALLAHPELLRTQARALARASIHGPIHVVYPIISGIEQFLALRRLFDEATAGLLTGDLRHGALFEVPAACLDASRLMRTADFGCIGTNDLIQYLFGVDRMNGGAASQRGFENESVLWELINQLARAASSLGKSMTICGELAGNPDLTCRIMKCGITAISTSPTNVAIVRRSAEQCSD